MREEDGYSAESVGPQCPDCGRHLTLTNKGEDGRCRTCNDKALDEAARAVRTPERLRNWARVTRNVVSLAGPDFKPADLADCEERIAAWEAEADAMEAK